MTESFEQWMARNLSFYQWEFLADHFEGPRRVLPNEAPTRLALANRKLLKCDQCYKPQFTYLTERGHAVMCAAMGLMADVLIRTAHLKPDDVKRMEKYGYGKCPSPTGHKVDGDLSAIADNRS